MLKKDTSGEKFFTLEKTTLFPNSNRFWHQVAAAPQKCQHGGYVIKPIGICGIWKKPKKGSFFVM